MEQNLFSLGLATGGRFCNRSDERTTLSNNIRTGKHTVLVSPRRYGKSSLANKVIDDLKLPYTAIDLFVAYDDKLICEKLIAGISQLVAKMTPFSKKALQLVENCFKNARAVIKAGHIELELSFSKPRFDPVTEILDTLHGLDKLAVKQKKRIVIFIDEFQNITFAQQASAIQGAIRSLAQQTKNIVFIFAGSSRKLLSHMFDDSNQPFYMLCKKMYLERIQPKHYFEYIQSASKTTWRQHLNNTVIEKILALTECHPLYVNLLCSELWLEKKAPDLHTVENTWDKCLQDEYRRIEAALEPLSVNQLNVLRAIGNSDHLTEPTGLTFIKTIGLSVASVQRAINYLYDYDYIYKDKTGIIGIIDPLIKKALREL